MATGDRRDPYHSYHFLVEIDGLTRAGFRECSGMDSTQDPIDYREGDDGLEIGRQPDNHAPVLVRLKKSDPYVVFSQHRDVGLSDQFAGLDRQAERTLEHLELAVDLCVRWRLRDGGQIDPPPLERTTGGPGERR